MSSRGVVVLVAEDRVGRGWVEGEDLERVVSEAGAGEAAVAAAGPGCVLCQTERRHQRGTCHTHRCLE